MSTSYMYDYMCIFQMQVLLSEYLDLSQLGNSQQQAPAAFTEAATDISSFFTKKRTPR